MRVPAVSLLVVLLVAPSGGARAQAPDAGAILAAAREALGGEKRLTAVTAFVATGRPPVMALIWAAHIGFDRMLGYGLKYPTGFGDTHLGAIGRRREHRTAGSDEESEGSELEGARHGRPHSPGAAPGATREQQGLVSQQRRRPHAGALAKLAQQGNRYGCPLRVRGEIIGKNISSHRLAPGHGACSEGSRGRLSCDDPFAKAYRSAETRRAALRCSSSSRWC